MLRQALTRPRHLVHKTKLRAKGRNTNPNSSPRSAEGKLSLRVCLPTDRVGWSGKETSVSDVPLKYPLWQNHYLQAMAETLPELLCDHLDTESADILRRNDFKDSRPLKAG